MSKHVRDLSQPLRQVLVLQHFAALWLGVRPENPGCGLAPSFKQRKVCASHPRVPKSKRWGSRLTTKRPRWEKIWLRRETVARPELTWFTVEDSIENRGRAPETTFVRFLRRDIILQNLAILYLERKKQLILAVTKHIYTYTITQRNQNPSRTLKCFIILNSATSPFQRFPLWDKAKCTHPFEQGYHPGQRSRCTLSHSVWWERNPLENKMEVRTKVRIWPADTQASWSHQHFGRKLPDPANVPTATGLKMEDHWCWLRVKKKSEVAFPFPFISNSHLYWQSCRKIILTLYLPTFLLVCRCVWVCECVSRCVCVWVGGGGGGVVVKGLNQGGMM